MKDEPVLIYTTYPSVVEAERAGRKLVESGLCACVNSIPGMHSIYRWKGTVEQADEAVMILKTRSSLADRASAAVKTGHRNEMPAILVLPVSGGNKSFLDWILAETNNPK